METTTETRVPIINLKPFDCYRTERGGPVLELIKSPTTHPDDCDPQKAYVRQLGSSDPIGSSIYLGVDMHHPSVYVIPVSDYVARRKRLNIRLIGAMDRVEAAHRAILDLAQGDDYPARTLVAGLLRGAANDVLTASVARHTKEARVAWMEALADAAEATLERYKTTTTTEGA